MRSGLFLIFLLTPAVCTAQDVATMQMRSLDVSVSPEGLDLPNDGPTRRKVWMFGTCIAKHPTGEMLAQLPESSLDRRIEFGMSMVPGRCAHTGNYSENAPMFLRGVFAEHSLTHDFALATEKPLRRHAKVFELPSEAKRVALNDKQKATLSFVEYGACVAAADMPAVTRLVAAEVGSAAENEAFGFLGPALGKCLTPGMTLRVNRLKLRGYLAEGAYRYLSAKADQQ